MKTKIISMLSLVGIMSSIVWLSLILSPDNKLDSGSVKKLQLSHQKQIKKRLPAQSPKGAGVYYAHKRLAKGHSRIPSENYVDAIRDKRQYFSAIKGQLSEPWQSLGPNTVGGRTRSFIFHPVDSDIMYAGGVSGGIWKSTDAGAQWTAIGDDLENIAVVTIALVPEQPNILFAGTGEGIYIGRPIVRSRGVEGNGIYRSTDDGTSWQALTFTLNNPDFRFVNKIRVAQDGSVFAATGRGIWRSLDSGISWTLVLDQAARVGGCNEVEIQPASSPNSLLVSCGSFENSAVFKTSDNGDSWNSVIEDNNQGRTTIAYAPSNPNRVYALAAQNQFGDFPYGLNGFYRSDDGGDNWLLVNDVNSSNFNNRAILSTTNYVFDCSSTGQYQAGRLFGGGWYYNLLVVDPTDQDRVWSGGLDLWRSDDGGQNFNLGSFWWAPEEQASFIHADHHSLVYHPNYDGVNETRLFASNDGGIWHTSNPTANTASDNCDFSTSSVDWQSLNNGYAVTQFYHGSVARDGKTLIAGSQDNGTQRRDESGSWERILGGDGSYSAIDPEDPSRVFVSSQYANIARINIQNGQNQVTDISADFEGPGLFITPFILDANNNDRLWLAGLALWRGENGGQNWVKASSDEYEMNFIDGLSAVAVQPGNSNLVILGGTDGFIYRQTNALSSDRNSNMQKIKIADGYISSINFDRNNRDKLVASVSTFGELHAWMSQDAGLSWLPLDQPGAAGLPDLPVHDIIIAPHDSNTLYVATDIGVYTSENNGVDWSPLAAGLPNVPVEKIVYNRFDLTSKLFAFTYGRGVFNTVLSEAVNLAPEATHPSFTLQADQDQSIQFSLADKFDDPNGDLLTFSATGLANGLSLNSNGEITGASNLAGNFAITLMASDGELQASADLTLSISEVEQQSSGGGGGLNTLFLFTLGLLVHGRKKVNSESYSNSQASAAR